ncbi:MAG TPA: hypothetical protein VGG11_09935 [Xanthobacteraceae bacterium]|jgi:ABC-type branched-subunit amino acid transport system ATPase component
MVLVEHDIDVVFQSVDCVTVLVNRSMPVTGSSERVNCEAAVRQAHIGNGQLTGTS